MLRPVVTWQLDKGTVASSLPARLSAVGVGLAALVWSVSARADWDGTLAWKSVGVNVGASHDRSDTNLLLGAEASMGGTYLLAWGGGYMDAVYDTGTGNWRFSIGPEVGLLCLGLDAGLMIEVRDGQVEPGFVLRPMLAGVYVFPYARFGWRAEAGTSGFTEFGLLFKYPFTNE